VQVTTGPRQVARRETSNAKERQIPRYTPTHHQNESCYRKTSIAYNHQIKSVKKGKIREKNLEANGQQ